VTDGQAPTPVPFALFFLEVNNQGHGAGFRVKFFLGVAAGGEFF
jgi:hypothetical protein